MDIREWVIDEKKILAHRKEGKDDETLFEHSELVLHYFNKFEKENGLKKVITNITHSLSECRTTQKLLYRLFKNAVYYHDLGKINPNFQRHKMMQDVKGTDSSNSNHSLLSSILFYHVVKKEWEKEDDYQKINDNNKILLDISLFAAMYAISKHHSSLSHTIDAGKPEKWFKEGVMLLKDQIKKENDYIKWFKGKDGLLKTVNKIGKFLNRFTSHNNSVSNSFDFYIYTKMMYSTLVSCDFYATYHYMNNEEVDFYYLDGKAKKGLLETYQSGAISKNIEAYKKDSSIEIKEINRLRCEMFIEAEAMINNHKDNHLFYLEAPTGSGKTNTSINLALNILNENETINKIMYVFPFNTLIDQTKKTLDAIFPKEVQEAHRMSVINSLTPILEDDYQVSHKDDNRLKKEVLRRQMIQYPVTLTSHVNFFQYLFGTKREKNLGLVHLANSVIILDEIQSYKSDIWKKMINFLDRYGKLLNIKLIIMSATLPPLEWLQDESIKPIRLIQNREKFFSNNVFKSRIKTLNYDLLNNKGDKEEVFNLLCQKVDSIYKRRGKARILFEFINKKTARSFYNQLKTTFPEKIILELTGYDTKSNRDKIVSFLKEKENGTFKNQDIILVATQVIEAGVDIDMDVGFKDVSILDSEEQFLGRINRSCEREDAVVYFFDLDDSDTIYKKDWRIEKDLHEESIQDILLNKTFDQFYELPLKRINEEQTSGSNSLYDGFKGMVRQLNFEKVEKEMELIENDTITLFFNFNHNGMKGSTVWDSYQEIIRDKRMTFEERTVKLSKIKSLMEHYSFSYRMRGKTPIQCGEEDIMGDIFYIENGEDFVTKEGELYKFDFETFEESQVKCN